MSRHFAAALGLLLTMTAVPARAQDTLVAIRGLGPRALRTQYFALDSAQSVAIMAVGAEPQGRTAVRKFLDNGILQSREKGSWDTDVWPANAWILDAKTRSVVWELRAAPTRNDGSGLRSFDGVVRLGPGTYEVYYAALYPVSHVWKDGDDWRVRPSTGAAPAVDQLHGPYIDDGAYHSFRITVRGSGRRVTRDAANAERAATELVALRGAKPNSRERIGFELDRPMNVDIYLVGEGENGWDDYGWVLDASTRKLVWSARDEPFSAAGGARKNRMIRRSLSLPAGRYVAGFLTDDSHEISGWNETPPYDPASWGMTVRLTDAAAMKAARTFAYQPVPTADAFVTLTKTGNDELRWQRFAVSRPIDVRVFALGEGSGDDMADYGWIVDQHGRRVWRMEQSETEPAGGANKNRVFAGTIHLPAGSYTAYYRSDGSHSFGGGWNAAEPMDAEFWGITLAPVASGDANAVTRIDKDDASADGVIARVTQVRGGRTGETRFSLPRRTVVRIYAVGEGSGEMFDYGMIQDSSGQTTWQMRYDETEPAGGASKNRRVDRTLALDAGTYTLRFKTDGSHGWDNWNAEPPDDPLAYGVTLFRARP
jgi:hypothetical protein